jgi:hypothetical protein
VKDSDHSQLACLNTDDPTSSIRGLAQPFYEWLIVPRCDYLHTITFDTSSTYSATTSISSVSHRSLQSSPVNTVAVMLIARTFVRSSRLYSRQWTSRTCRLRPTYVTGHVPRQVRKLATTATLFQESIETLSRGPEVPLTHITSAPSGTYARSVAVLKLPEQTMRSDIEELFRNRELEMYVDIYETPNFKIETANYVPLLSSCLLLFAASTYK